MDDDTATEDEDHDANEVDQTENIKVASSIQINCPLITHNINRKH